MNELAVMFRSDAWCASSLGVLGARFVGVFLLAASIAVSGAFGWQTALAVVAFVALDELDGTLFRRSARSMVGSSRAIRRALDSIVDRLSVQLVSLSVLAADFSYLPLFVAVLAREVAVCVPCIRACWRGLVIYPNRVSKISTVSVACVGIAYILGAPSLAYVFAVPMLASAVFAVRDYCTRLDAIDRGEGRLGVDYELAGSRG